MKTMLVNQNGNETINAEIQFRVIMGTLTTKRYDQFIYKSYSKAKDRIETLKRIFRAYTYEIIIVES